MRPIALLLALAGAALLAAPQIALAADTARLSNRDRAQIAQLACGGTEAAAVERIDGSFEDPELGTLRAEVRCAPRAVRESLPTALHTRCTNHQGPWRCDAGREAQILTLRDDSRVAVMPEGVRPALALELVREAAALSVPPFHESAVAWLKGRCSVYPSTGTELGGATHYAIDCDAGTLSITRHCWSNGCRHFIALGRERP